MPNYITKTPLLAILIVSLIAPALADIDEDQPLIYTHTLPTAYTLRENVISIGLMSFDYGLSNRAQFGLNPFLCIFGVLNADVKYKFVDTPHFALAANIDGYYSIIDNADGGAFIFSAIASVPATKWLQFHVGPNYLHLTDEEISPGNDTTGFALLMSSSVPASIELLLNSHNVLVGDVNFELDTDEISYFASYIHSWEHFNAQIGLVAHRTWDMEPIAFVNIWWRI